MDRSVDIFAKLALSLNGEDMSVDAAENRITVRPSSFRSGLRILTGFGPNFIASEHATQINTALVKLGWTLYAHVGLFTIAIFGLKAKRSSLKALSLFGRLCRAVGIA